SRPQDLKTSRPQDLKTSRPQDLKTSRPQDLKASDCLAAAGRPKSEHLGSLNPLQASKYLSSSVNRKGFTLVEIIVALCIVAILTAIAVPGFRKATEDFRLNATLEDTVDILKAFRAYYLIFNEFPPDATVLSAVPGRLKPFLPSRLINPATGKWNVVPLGNKAYCYDVDNWMSSGSNRPRSIGISLYGIKQSTVDWNKCYNKFKSCVGERYITPWIHNNSHMICLLPECPGSTIPNSTTKWENRYY
ncbi:MAG: type II secretion system GspH family protein, partial [Puniceicoccales bacterium]|nr:type II secretion system GspH family protein [Puniceicoccales bacterium]